MNSKLLFKKKELNRNKIFNLFMTIIVVFFSFACQKEKRKTASGLKYSVVRNGEGEMIKKGEYLLLNFVYYEKKDSLMFDTYENGHPFIIKKRDSVWVGTPGDINEIFYELRKGDSISFKIKKIDLFQKTFKQQITGDSSSFYNLITFEVGVEDILNEEQWRALREKQTAKSQKEADLTAQKDKEKIEQYLKENNISAEITESGLFYTIQKQGEGDNPKSRQYVTVNYSGYLLNGKLFDTSIESVAKKEGVYNENRAPYKPFSFVLGVRRVIKGWDEGIALLNKGAQATFYIPSGLAYGKSSPSKDIPPNSVLVFDVELIDIYD